jgi:hypothetical protein
MSDLAARRVLVANGSGTPLTPSPIRVGEPMKSAHVHTPLGAYAGGSSVALSGV